VRYRILRLAMLFVFFLSPNAFAQSDDEPKTREVDCRGDFTKIVADGSVDIYAEVGDAKRCLVLGDDPVKIKVKRGVLHIEGPKENPLMKLHVVIIQAPNIESLEVKGRGSALLSRDQPLELDDVLKIVASIARLKGHERNIAQALASRSPDIAAAYLEQLKDKNYTKEQTQAAVIQFIRDPVAAVSFAPDKTKPRDAQIENKVWSFQTGAVPEKGPPDAPVTIVIFSDFQCPFCGRAAATMDKLENKYPGKIRFKFVSKILPFHKKAQLAHQAAYAAWDQGKFWEYHDLLFANQMALDENDLIMIAKKLGLNPMKFRKDMSSNKHQKDFDRDEELSREVDVRGTPNFFVNGIKVLGARPAEDFEKIIDALLAGQSPEDVVKNKN
jgi:protein-disulfide isomerase